MLLRLAALGLASMLAVSSAGCASASDGTDATDAAVADDDRTLEASLTAPLPESDLDTFAERASWIDTYGAIPADCVAKHDERDGRRALFHGCYDWHSSVHAHFAVLRMDLAGTGKRARLAEQIDARLTPEEIARVAAELEAEPWFESPYGRAWLLRLVTEHETWSIARTGTADRRLRSLGEATAAGLVASFATRTPDPKAADYRSDAWTLAQLVAYARATKDAALEQSAVRLVEAGFTQRPLRWSETNDHDPNAFMSTYWSQVCLLATTFAADPSRLITLLAPSELPDEALTPLPDPGIATDVHHLGINWSRAWAIKALARVATTALGPSDATTKKLVAAYHAHVLAGRERHFRYRGDYFAYDHWVPQFAVYAITD